MKDEFKNIKAIVSDYDGTIARAGMTEPSEELFLQIEKLSEQGIRFVVASGRQYSNLRARFAPVADRIDYICENGSLVVYKKEVIYKNIIAKDVAKQLITDMEKCGDAELLISGPATSYLVPRSAAYEDKMRNQVRNNVTVLKSFDEIPEDIIKASVYWKSGIPKKEEAFFHEKYDTILQVADGGDGWLDFTDKQSNKANALTILAEKMQIKPEEMLSFGDSENDISMLKLTGKSVCMCTAKDHVKAYAHMERNSVEETLQEFFALF